jgi:hypothetical protein
MAGPIAGARIGTVIVGGALRGLTRARRISTQVVLTYFAVGIPLAVLGQPLYEPDPYSPFWLIATILMGPFLSAPPLFLMSLMANMFFARLFPKRTWRNERWRGWLAGSLGVLLTCGGMQLVPALSHGPPKMFQSVFGSASAGLYLGGWFVLLCNLGLLVAWLIPSQRS